MKPKPNTEAAETAQTTDSPAVVHECLVRRDLWNKCDVCGRIISYADLESGKAIRNMKTPDSEVSIETWETLCRDHYQPNGSHQSAAPSRLAE